MPDLTPRERMIDEAVRVGFARVWIQHAPIQLIYSARTGFVAEFERAAICRAFRNLPHARDSRGRFTKRPA